MSMSSRPNYEACQFDVNQVIDQQYSAGALEGEGRGLLCPFCGMNHQHTGVITGYGSRAVDSRSGSAIHFG